MVAFPGWSLNTLILVHVAFDCIYQWYFQLQTNEVSHGHVFPAGIMQQDNSEQVIINPRLIARHYIGTWFFLDLISSIPLDYIFLIFNSIRGSDVSCRVENGPRSVVVRPALRPFILAR